MSTNLAKKPPNHPPPRPFRLLFFVFFCNSFSCFPEEEKEKEMFCVCGGCCSACGSSETGFPTEFEVLELRQQVVSRCPPLPTPPPLDSLSVVCFYSLSLVPIPIAMIFHFSAVHCATFSRCFVRLLAESTSSDDFFFGH